MNVTLRLKGTPTLRLRYQPGLVGPAGTITVGTVTTGSPGSSVIVTNSGTSQAATLNFTIPRGDTGATGDDGWSPILAIVSDGLRRVVQIADWTGGEGTKPATGSYIGPTGLVTPIGDAVDIRGEVGPSGSVTDGDKGDITVSTSGTVWTVDNDAVTNAKLANVATATIKGRASSGTGDPEDLTPAQALAVIGGLGVAQSGFRNLIINGSFTVNQRAYGGSSVGAGVYTFDRWKAGASGVTFSAAGGSATISAGSLAQVIEGANIAYTGSYVLNWAGTATATLSGVAATKGMAFTLTSGANYVLEFSPGTVGAVQLEPGLFATTFENRPYDLELMLCERYYQRFGEATTITVGDGFAIDANDVVASIPLSRPMRAAPTLSVSAAADIVAASTGGIAATTAIAINASSPGGRKGVEVYIDTSGSYVSATPVLIRVGAGGWIAFDSEI